MDIAARRRKRTALTVAQRRVTVGWTSLPEWLTLGALVEEDQAKLHTE